MESEQTVVIYYYRDPSYKADISSVVDALESKGFRVVQGDNADELMFLLQVGRPAAIIFTLATEESRTQGHFQTISSRAFELLVPIVLVGPDDPREGLVLMYPTGKKVEKRHFPIHSLDELVRRFHSNPPSTPSRPPEFIEEQTVGKGRPLPNWRSDSSESGDQVVLVEPSGAGMSRPRPEAGLVKTVESFKKNEAEEETTEPVPVVQEDTGIPKWKLVYGFTMILAIISVGALTMIFAEQLNGTSATAGDTSRSRVSRVKESLVGEPVTQPKQISDNAGAPSDAKRHPEQIKKDTDTDSDTVEAADSNVAESLPEDALKEKGSADTDGEEEIPTQRDKVRPELDEAEESGVPAKQASILFPGRFRKGSAKFWFADNDDKKRFMKIIKNRPKGSSIRVIGHPTAEDIRNRKAKLGKGRAKAVAKYLIKRGVDPASITSERGDTVPGKGDLDEKGNPQNRWVDVIFE